MHKFPFSQQTEASPQIQIKRSNSMDFLNATDFLILIAWFVYSSVKIGQSPSFSLLPVRCLAGRLRSTCGCSFDCKPHPETCELLNFEDAQTAVTSRKKQHVIQLKADSCALQNSKKSETSKRKSVANQLRFHPPTLSIAWSLMRIQFVILPNIPANVFRRLFIVSSGSGSSRSRAIASNVRGDGGPEGRGLAAGATGWAWGRAAGVLDADDDDDCDGSEAAGGADDGLQST